MRGNVHTLQAAFEESEAATITIGLGLLSVALLLHTHMQIDADCASLSAKTACLLYQAFRWKCTKSQPSGTELPAINVTPHFLRHAAPTHSINYSASYAQHHKSLLLEGLQQVRSTAGQRWVGPLAYSEKTCSQAEGANSWWRKVLELDVTPLCKLEVSAIIKRVNRPKGHKLDKMREKVPFLGDVHAIRRATKGGKAKDKANHCNAKEAPHGTAQTHRRSNRNKSRWINQWIKDTETSKAAERLRRSNVTRNG